MSLNLDPQGYPPAPDGAAANMESPRVERARRSHLADRVLTDPKPAEALCQLRPLVALLIDASFGLDPVRLARAGEDDFSKGRGAAPGKRP